MIDVTMSSALAPNAHETRPHLSRLLRLATLAAGAALLNGCVILDLGGTSSGSGSGSSAGSGSGAGTSSSSGAGMGTSTPPLTPLPPPSVWRVELPALDAEQQKRADEVAQFLAEQYEAQGWKIVETIQTFSGDIIDWLDPASVEGSQKEPPPKPTPEEMKLPDGVALLQTELDLFPELRGPAGTVPVMRPSFAAYIGGITEASSLEDFLANHVVTGDPTGAHRLYAGISRTDYNHGASAWISAFDGLIEPGTMSLLELAVGCRNQATTGTEKPEIAEQVGIAASKDWARNGLLTGNFGDSLLRLQVEFLTHGDGWTGQGKGGWEGTATVGDFKPVAGAPYPPGVVIPIPSKIGGPQREALYAIRFANDAWWVGWNGSWLGYYESSLFPNELYQHACEALWYGEVYDPKSTPTTWTWTDMGSGQFAAAGPGNAAYFREPSYVNLAGGSLWPDNPGDLAPRVDACYTRTDLLSSAAPWDRYFYVGGPGGLGLDGGSLNCHGPN